MRWLLFRLRYTWRYLGYYLRALTCYDIHSPFVSTFIAATLEDQRHYYVFDGVAELRRQLSRSTQLVELTDHGAGSFVSRADRRRVSHLARHSAVSPAAGKLLFRMALFLRPDTLLELGTSLGISAIYLGSANPEARLLTLEGSSSLSELASKHLRAAGLTRAEVRTGLFQENLPLALSELQRLDFVHLDGDHRRAPTLAYFEACLPHAHEQTVFCLSDIYWSKEMLVAWEELKQHPKVTFSIDLFYYGLLFLRPEVREKQHFTLIAARRKPWRLGFWA